MSHEHNSDSSLDWILIIWTGIKRLNNFQLNNILSDYFQLFTYLSIFSFIHLINPSLNYFIIRLFNCLTI